MFGHFLEPLELVRIDGLGFELGNIRIERLKFLGTRVDLQFGAVDYSGRAWSVWKIATAIKYQFRHRQRNGHGGTRLPWPKEV